MPVAGRDLPETARRAKARAHEMPDHPMQPRHRTMKSLMSPRGETVYCGGDVHAFPSLAWLRA